MDEETYSLGPEYWSISDLDRPSPECDLPEPVRLPDSSNITPVCPHCGTRYQMVQTGEHDGNGNYIEIWVDYGQHQKMVESWDLGEERSYR